MEDCTLGAWTEVGKGTHLKASEMDCSYITRTTMSFGPALASSARSRMRLATTPHSARCSIIRCIDPKRMANVRTTTSSSLGARPIG